MANKDIKFYLSKAHVFGLLIIVPPMIIFGLFSIKSYKQNLPVSIIFGIAAIIFLIMAIDLIQCTYFIITKRPALILTEGYLIDKLNNNELTWYEIKEIKHKGNGFKTPGTHILITSKTSDESIRIRSRLVNSSTGKTITKPEILRLLVSFHEKYGNKK